jgi:chemotaxis protein methyltransferase WspC
MRLPEFEDVLKRAIGLDAETIGASSVSRAVAVRMEATGIKNVDAYRFHVANSAAELQQLVEAIVVPETWFFRDREAFAALAATAREKVQSGVGVFRALSVPCSTGEEPYSMAMALLDAGLTREQIHIDAIDVSLRALERARQAIYGRNSFRGADLAFRDRHFGQASKGSAISKTVRDCVSFEHGNLFDDRLLVARAPYHAIFCRNLLIYFDGAGKDRAVRVLDRLLTSDGTLFVGPSETSLLLDHQFTSARIRLAFAFRKKAAEARKPTRADGTHAKPRPAIRRPAPAPLAPPLTTAPAAKAATTLKPPMPGIEDIRRLADEGRSAEAAALCEARLREGGASPEILLILGLIRDSMGQVRGAAECYRKALFLDPDHAQALVHLALLHEKEGNTADVRILNERLRRLEQRRAG